MEFNQTEIENLEIEWTNFEIESEPIGDSMDQQPEKLDESILQIVSQELSNDTQESFDSQEIMEENLDNLLFKINQSLAQCP